MHHFACKFILQFLPREQLVKVRKVDLGENMRMGWLPRKDIDPLVLWSPRRYNTVPDHLANAAMDQNKSWHWLDEAGLQDEMARGRLLKICVDGGLRGHHGMANRPAAIACAVYRIASAKNPVEKPCQTLILLSATPVTGFQSAFQAEVTAVDWTLDLLERILKI